MVPPPQLPRGRDSDAPGSAAAKLALRDQLLTARSRLSAGRGGRGGAPRSPSTCWRVPSVRRAATVAAYVSIGTEPGTGLLLDALVAAGKRVLLPVVLPDLDLDWAVYDGPGRWCPRGWACSSRPARGSASTRSRPPTSCWSRASRSSPAGHPAGPRRRLLRPGPRAGAGRHVHVRAAVRRRGRRGGTRSSRTTGRVLAAASPSGLSPPGPASG